MTIITKFELFEEEIEEAKQFEQEHEHSEIPKGTIHGHLNYKFCPNSIGRTVFVQCGICGEERDITDYGNW